MGVLLITGAHQSGKTRAAWQLLRDQAVGTAVLCTPDGVLTHDLLRAWHGAMGSGSAPATIALDRLLALAAAGDAPAPAPAVAAHAVKAWASARLGRGPFATIAGYRATAEDLSAACRRFDAHLVDAAALGALGAACAREDARLGGKIAVLAEARSALAARGLGTGGAPLVPSPERLRWSTVVLDDLINLDPAQLAALRALGARCELVITAVDDDRLGRGSLCERLRLAFPGAAERRLGRLHPRAPQQEPMRAVVERALGPLAFPADAVSLYHYHDDHHAGRAIAAWLKRAHAAPGEALVFVRTAGAEALALCDALIAAGVPAQGRFRLPLGATAPGGLLLALGRWCARGDWAALLEVLARVACGTDGAALAPELPATIAPTPPLDLRGPWGGLRDREAVARLERLAAGEQQVDLQRWSERDHRRLPCLRATCAWIQAWIAALEALAPRQGAWLARVSALARALGLVEAQALFDELEAMAAHAPVGVAEFEERIGVATATVARGEGAPMGTCVLVVDAVRGRSLARPVAFLHGLEHGRWPATPARGVCFARDERRAIARALERSDPWDEVGQASGEVAAILAVIARATARLVVGVPCGEREPSPVAAALVRQAAQALDRERAAEGDEACPGAPLGPADSQGAHERALWATPRRTPSFAFRVGRRAPAELGLAVSKLNDLLTDPFALVLDGLCVHPPLADAGFSLAGEDIHAALAQMARQPPAAWDPEAVAQAWIARARDALEARARQRVARAIAAAVAAERALAGGWQVDAEVPLDIDIPLPDGQGGAVALRLRGRADRVDRRARDGRVEARLVDYKLQSLKDRRRLLIEGRDGQLAAYSHALAGMGLRVEGAYYRTLRDGEAAGYHGAASPESLGRDPLPVSAVEAQVGRLGAAIAALAGGEAATEPERGLCASRGYAPIARLDEGRHAEAAASEDAAEDGEP